MWSTTHTAWLAHRTYRLWFWVDKFEEAKSEALRALYAFEELGAAKEVGATRWFLAWLDRHGSMPEKIDSDSVTPNA